MSMPEPCPPSSLSDADLLALLDTAEDRLSRDAVEEFVRRRERMLAPLTAICRDEAAWKGEGADFWKPVHAAYILGAMGGLESIQGLLAALHFSTLHDLDWVSESMPSIFADLGAPAIPHLVQRAGDTEAVQHERALAIVSLGAIAIRWPDLTDQVLAVLRETASQGADEEVRCSAGNALLDFARPEDRPLIDRIARLNRDEAEWPLFRSEEVEDAYRRGGRPREYAPRGWLYFYDPQEIDARQARWRGQAKGAGSDEDEETRIDREVEGILRKFDATLEDLDYGKREQAGFVASTMTRFLLDRCGVAAWEWNTQWIADYFDRYVKKLGTEDLAEVRLVPDFVIRVLRFWEAEGKLGQDVVAPAVVWIEASRSKFVRRAIEPGNFSFAKGMTYRMRKDGVDLQNRRAVSEWTGRFNREIAGARLAVEPGIERVTHAAPSLNAPCPCGSGKKYKRCCGRQ